MTSFKTFAPKNTGVVIDPVEHQSYTWVGMHNILNQPNLLWGTPTILRDFGLLELKIDPTLADGSEAILLEAAS